MQHKQQYMHHSHRNNRPLNIGYHDNLTDRPRTTTGLHTLHNHTDLAVLIHTRQNFKWSRYTLTTLNISQLQTFIDLLETAHPRTTKQLTQIYNTAYCSSQSYHTLQVWIYDICHRQIQVRKQISIRGNMIEHWVHLRCASIRQAQYTDT